MLALMQRVAKSAIVVSLALSSIALGITPGNSGNAIIMVPDITVAQNNFANGNSGTFSQPAPDATINVGLLPYQKQIDLTIQSGNSNGVVMFTAPSGRELVIQTISMYRNGALASGSTVLLYIYPTVQSVMGAYALPLVGDMTTGPYPGSTWTGVLYADPGTTVQFTAYRSGTTGYQEVDGITVSGYLASALPILSLPPSGAR
jgi:hypothetical protein